MSAQDRKEYAFLHKELIDILTKCKTDRQFYKRLKWAKTIIENSLNDFSPEEIDEYES